MNKLLEMANTDVTPGTEDHDDTALPQTPSKTRVKRSNSRKSDMETLLALAHANGMDLVPKSPGAGIKRGSGSREKRTKSGGHVMMESGAKRTSSVGEDIDGGALESPGFGKKTSSCGDLNDILKSPKTPKRSSSRKVKRSSTSGGDVHDDPKTSGSSGIKRTSSSNRIKRTRSDGRLRTLKADNSDNALVRSGSQGNCVFKRTTSGVRLQLPKRPSGKALRVTSVSSQGSGMKNATFATEKPPPDPDKRAQLSNLLRDFYSEQTANSTTAVTAKSVPPSDSAISEQKESSAPTGSRLGEEAEIKPTTETVSSNLGDSDTIPEKRAKQVQFGTEPKTTVHEFKDKQEISSKFYSKEDLKVLLNHEVQICIRSSVGKQKNSKGLHCCWRGLEHHKEKDFDKDEHRYSHAMRIIAHHQELRAKAYVLEVQAELMRDVADTSGSSEPEFRTFDMAEELRKVSCDRSKGDRKKAHKYGLEDASEMRQELAAVEKDEKDKRISAAARKPMKRANSYASLGGFFTQSRPKNVGLSKKVSTRDLFAAVKSATLA